MNTQKQLSTARQKFIDALIDARDRRITAIQENNDFVFVKHGIIENVKSVPDYICGNVAVVVLEPWCVTYWTDDRGENWHKFKLELDANCKILNIIL